MESSFTKSFKLSGKVSAQSYPNSQSCYVELKLTKKKPLHSPIILEVYICIKENRIFRYKTSLIWEDMHLLDIRDLALMFSNARKLANKELGIYDPIKREKLFSHSLSLWEGCHGIGIIIDSDRKRVRINNTKQEKRLWFVEWSFKGPKTKYGDVLWKSPSFQMIVDPSECERFGNELQSFVYNLDINLFKEWAKE